MARRALMNPEDSPFDLGATAAYQRWREQKLDTAARRLDDLMVRIADPRCLTPDERAQIILRCAHFNMAIYATDTAGDADTGIVRAIGRQLGLNSLDGNWLADDDGISSLAVARDGNAEATSSGGPRGEFIPYTDRAIGWHTDGYYNPPQRKVRGMILHCARDAWQGGENRLLDHEIAYLVLRDENPEFIRALSLPDVMLIPARMDGDGMQRADQPGPVFSVSDAGHLHMRFTARTRSIAWRPDAATQAALAALQRLLTSPSPWTLRARLSPGMGLICNNVLHDRAAFANSAAQQRLIYRARYLERVKPVT